MINLQPLATQDIRFYIDPGTLAMVIQVLIAGVITSLFMFKVFWGKVRHFVSSLFSRRKGTDE